MKINTLKPFVVSLLIVFMVSFIMSCEDNELSDLLEEEAIADDDANDDTDDGTADLVTYVNTAKGILDNACVQCHNGSNANGGVMLHTYANAAAVAESGRMIIRMTDITSPMPPSGNLPDPIIQDIMDWIDDGLLEN